MTNQFYETKTMFENYTGCTANVRLPYEEWLRLHTPGDDSNSKAAAALFVMFFDEITLAWEKAKADFIQDEDGIECVLQYLQKNVDVIRKNRSRYTPNYIYRVAYNCMDCLRYVEREQFRSKLTSSNVVPKDGEELDLYDMSPDSIDYDLELTRKEFWETIEGMDDQTAKVINHLLNGESLYKVSARAANRDNDPLKDVSVTKQEMAAIIEKLQEKLEKFKPAFLGNHEELETATEEDLVPRNMRKQPKLTEQVKTYIESQGSINLVEAERLFLLTRKPLNTMMRQLQEAGFPVVAHRVDVLDSVVPNKEIEMIDYYYLAK